MDKDMNRQLSSEGGKKAHRLGRAHEFNSEEARKAGKKGGERVSRDRKHMALIGRKGGRAGAGGNKFRR